MFLQYKSEYGARKAAHIAAVTAAKAKKYKTSGREKQN
jgi:hypothetical protein